jgi:class 3 adenylate cyclase/predicted ATPase
MTFDEILAQVTALLEKDRRVSYRALKRRFQLDDDYLEDIKHELIKAKKLAVDEDGSVLVWAGPAPEAPGPAPPAPARAPVEAAGAERRQLTVMFTDVVDSTRLSRQLDPEEYRDVLGAYQATCAEVVQRLGGYIAQHLGDALLVYFGYPETHEDEARRAILAGLGILDAMQTLNARLTREKGLRLATRVGLHTGLTVVGHVGAGVKHELLALGEAPNIAARIQSLVAPDTVGVSVDTYRLVEGYFDCEDFGVHALKGVAEPMKVYRVLHESGALSRLDAAGARGFTPLVGRESEVALLVARALRIAEGQGHVVLLSGEAGIGKSRLVQVVKDRVAGEGYVELEGRSSPYCQDTALFPLIRLWERLCTFAPDDSADVKARKLEGALGRYRLPLDESVPLFAGLLSVPLPHERYATLAWTPQRQRQKILETMAAIILELAEQQRVVFVLEDLHWVDPTSLEFLELLVDQAPTAAMLILLTCRPTFQPPAHWSNRSYVTQMTLDRLSRQQIEEMTERVAGGRTLPPEITVQLVDKTDGVPLFVEEMTKTVLESGLLQEVEGRYELTRPLPPLAIPATLQDSLMARLDRLVTAKKVAQLGAAIGRQFAYELLAPLSDLDEATLQRELERLVEAELLYQRGVPPRATYTFKHALIRDAAYESLLKTTRQQYHREIARALETRFPDMAQKQPELLAHHFTEAGLAEPAVACWQQAGEMALRRSANVEAIRHLSKGLELLKSLPPTPDHTRRELILDTALGSALVATKGPAAPEVEAAYARAYTVCQQVEETVQLLPVLWGLWNFYLVRGELDTAHEVEEKFARFAQLQPEPMHRMWGFCAPGMELYYRGEFVPALAHLEEGIALHDPRDRRAEPHGYMYDAGVTSLSFLVWTLWALGDPDRARRCSADALALARELGNPFGLARALPYAAVLHQFLLEAPAVQELAEAAIVLARDQGFAQRMAWATILRGWSRAMQGQGAEGIAEIHQGLATFRAMGQALWRPYFLGLLADAYGSVGQPSEGLAVLTEAQATMERTGERHGEAELHRLEGTLLLQRSPDQHEAAESAFRRALQTARLQRARSFELRASTSLARLWRQRGRHAEARQLLADACRGFSEGLQTADLRDARELLEALTGGKTP